MTDELFSVPSQDSPRLAWMKRHGITIKTFAAEPEHPESWKCFTDKAEGYGNTEDEAIADFARNAGIRLWNEEGL